MTTIGHLLGFSPRRGQPEFTAPAPNLVAAPAPAPPERGTGGAYQPQLDGLRAVAIMGVLCHHGRGPGFFLPSRRALAPLFPADQPVDRHHRNLGSCLHRLDHRRHRPGLDRMARPLPLLAATGLHRKNQPRRLSLPRARAYHPRTIVGSRGHHGRGAQHPARLAAGRVVHRGRRTLLTPAGKTAGQIQTAPVPRKAGPQ